MRSFEYQAFFACLVQRKTIAKAFEGEAMAGYLPFMEAILTKYLARWAETPAGVDLRQAVGPTM